MDHMTVTSQLKESILLKTGYVRSLLIQPKQRLGNNNMLLGSISYD